MLRKKKGEALNRRARLDVHETGAEEELSNDPIAAALAARKQRLGDSSLSLPQKGSWLCLLHPEWCQHLLPDPRHLAFPEEQLKAAAAAAARLAPANLTTFFDDGEHPVDRST